MKKIITDEWCRSYDGEIFDGQYSSREEAIKDCDIGEYIGRAVKLEFEEDDLIGCEEQIIESLDESLYFCCGDASDSWEIKPNQEKELGKRISKVVIDYLNEENLQPNCYSVVDIEEVKGGAE